ncbi:MAG: ribonuclease HII [Rikenellaceae bacterium]|nr:ribonuclease HII [Rikenellaceae bacterium]
MLSNSMHSTILEAGLDEAGRGCLAGPVFAAAVILPHDFHHPLLNDSKQMTERARNLLRTIIEREAVAWAVVEVSPQRIDQINILNASIEGMNLAVERLGVRPEHLLVDGNRFHTSLDIPYTCVVKGDATYANIAAASVLAKTHRDECMIRLAEEFPEYGWKRNKGYPTLEHRKAILEHGITPHHRRSFSTGAEQLSLF